MIKQKEENFRSRGSIALAALIIVLLLAAGWAVWYYTRESQAPQETNQPVVGRESAPSKTAPNCKDLLTADDILKITGKTYVIDYEGSQDRGLITCTFKERDSYGSFNSIAVKTYYLVADSGVDRFKAADSTPVSGLPDGYTTVISAGGAHFPTVVFSANAKIFTVYCLGGDFLSGASTPSNCGYPEVKNGLADLARLVYSRVTK